MVNALQDLQPGGAELAAGGHRHHSREAMGQRIPVLTDRRACGPSQQVRDGLDGRLVTDPGDVPGLADVLVDMLALVA